VLIQQVASQRVNAETPSRVDVLRTREPWQERLSSLLDHGSKLVGREAAQRRRSEVSLRSEFEERCRQRRVIGRLGDADEVVDSASAESTKLVATWVRDEKLATLMPNEPKITSGEVVARGREGALVA
jgi:hypothetical protein